MRFYCRSLVYCYFREYVESIMRKQDQIILFKDGENLIIEDDNITNVFLSYVPPSENIELIYKNNKIINLFYLNTEQVTRPNIKDFINNNLSFLIKLKDKYQNVNIDIIDYSIQNITLLKNMVFLNSYNIYHIPYQYNEKENKKLVNFLKNKKIYDVAHCGTSSSYRMNILQKINNKKLGVNICTGYFDDRDIDIAKSKILINIHFEKTYNVFESIRCDRWIFANHLVLSEDSINDNLNDLKDCIVICKYEDLPNFTEKIINKYDIYKKLYINNKVNIRNKVIQARKELYDNFRNNFN